MGFRVLIEWSHHHSDTCHWVMYLGRGGFHRGSGVGLLKGGRGWTSPVCSGTGEDRDREVEGWNVRVGWPFCWRCPLEAPPPGANSSFSPLSEAAAQYNPEPPVSCLP